MKKLKSFFQNMLSERKVYTERETYNFTIGRKITLGFLSLFMLETIMVGIVIHFNNIIVRNSEDIRENAVKQAHAGNLRYYITKLIMYTNDYIITEDDSYRSLFEQQRVKVKNQQRKLHGSDLSNEELAITDSISILIDSIYVFAGRIFAIPSPRSSPQAAGLMEIMDYGFGEAVGRQTTEIFDIVFNDIEKNRIQSVRIKKQIRNTIYVSLFITLLLSTVVVFLTVKKIANPIKRLAEITDSIAKGNYSERIIVSTRDEVGLLARSFSRMTKEIEETHMNLEAQNRFITNVIATIPSGLLVIRRFTGKRPGEPVVLSVNRSFCELFNLTPQQVEGQSVGTVLQTIKLSDECQTAVALGRPYRNLECTCHVDPQAERVINITLTEILVAEAEESSAPINAGENLLVIDDITERKRAATELIQAKEKAEASDRLKTAFINNISHEVRTPLNGILGLSSLLSQPGLPDEDKAQFVTLLNASTNRLLYTITSYIDISLIVSGSIEKRCKTIVADQILNECKTRFQSLCDARKLELALLIPHDGRTVMLNTDPDLFRKILSHLLDNAVKFTSKGNITFGYSVKTGRIEFFVKDTGIGISKEDQERIFDPFMQGELTLTRSFEGSGLGLSIVKGFSDLLGGEIHLVSVKGEGTTFFFSLPLEPVPKEDEYMRKIRKEHPVQKNPLILITEDDETNYLYLATIVKRTPASVLYAVNGKEAVDLCRKHPEISLVLMDLRMPVMDGLEATREIKSFRKDLPVIALTAYAMIGDEKRALEAGCDDYLPKPVRKEILLEKLKTYGVV